MQQPGNHPVSEQPTPIKKTKQKVGFGTLAVIVAIVALIAFILGSRSESIWSWAFNKSGSSDNLDLASVQEVYHKLKQKYDGNLDTQALIDGAKKGLVEATGDPYTAYFTDEEAKQFLSDLNGTFSGIGAELGKKDNNLVVVTTIDESPAQKSGLRPNDVIAAVNGQETTGWTIEKAVSEIRGEEGTTVKLTILRDNQVKEISIERAEIVNPSVKSEIKNGVGILRVSRFSETDTIQLARRAADQFKEQNVKGVILDLRGNGGGYLKTAQELASLWLNKGQVVVEERKGNEQTDQLTAEGNAILAGVPTVVLIDGASASASEIVAGALKDHGAAKLVGAKSYGKGSVQDLLELPSGGQLKVTIAKWFTPNGRNISKEGIAPDKEVKITDKDIAGGKDPQKEKALELLAK